MFGLPMARRQRYKKKKRSNHAGENMVEYLMSTGPVKSSIGSDCQRTCVSWAACQRQRLPRLWDNGLGKTLIKANILFFADKGLDMADLVPFDEFPADLSRITSVSKLINVP